MYILAVFFFSLREVFTKLFNLSVLIGEFTVGNVVIQSMKAHFRTSGEESGYGKEEYEESDDTRREYDEMSCHGEL